MTPNHETLFAALHARRWARTRQQKTGQWPSVEARVTWIAKMFDPRKVDAAYVNLAVEGQEKEHATTS